MTLKRSSTHFYKRTPTILPVLHVLWEHLNSIVGAMSSNYEYKISHNSEAIFQMFHISYFTFKPVKSQADCCNSSFQKKRSTKT